jgi:osmoprotectant transport system permease protein
VIDVYQFITQHPDLLAEWVVDHLSISFVAIGAGIMIGVPVGIYITGRERTRLAEIVLYSAEIMMTVPSLALFGLIMLILSSMGLSAIGFLPAVLTLIFYGQLPILRNTYTAINDVDQSMIEAARGMGMSGRQVLLKVKLPLSLPVIMAGLRNATVLIIGITAIAALIGAGGLGVPIFRGLRNARIDLIIIGGVSVSLLALLVDSLMALAERWITPKGLKG